MSFLDTIFRWAPQLRKPDATLAEAQCDANGAQKVAIVSNLSAATTWVDPAPTIPLAYERVVAALPKKLHTAVVINEGVSTRWFMLFDSNVLAVNSAEPVFAVPIPAGGSATYDFDGRPRSFTSGIAWAASSTAGSLTRDTGAAFRANFEVE